MHWYVRALRRRCEADGCERESRVELVDPKNGTQGQYCDFCGPMIAKEKNTAEFEGRGSQ